MTALGTYIRQLRAAHNLSVRDLAKRAGLSPAFISDIELGRRYPSADALVNIAHVLGVSADDLRARDSRAPIEDMKRLAESDPLFSVALRAIIDREISGHQLLQMLDNRKGRKPRKRSR